MSSVPGAGELACAVTGASGYVGSRVAQAIAARGWTAVSLGRREGDLRYSLEHGVAAGSLAERKVKALVHCAYDFSVRGWERIRDVNVEGSRRLFETARADGIERIVFISSTAAFQGCRSRYGRAKLETERIAATYGAFIVRPGLVCGESPGGMVGTLVKVLRRSPIVPLIGSGRTLLHTVHEDDLCALIVRLLETPPPFPPPGIAITAASEDAVEFRELLRKIAIHEGRTVLWAPLPWRLVWVAVKALELAHVPSGLRSDSVISFVKADPRPDFTQTRLTGVTFRPFSLAAKR
jgi:nucleoside-diphosphate-sugar epimerase